MELTDRGRCARFCSPLPVYLKAGAREQARRGALLLSEEIC